MRCLLSGLRCKPRSRLQLLPIVLQHFAAQHLSHTLNCTLLRRHLRRPPLQRLQSR